MFCISASVLLLPVVVLPLPSRSVSGMATCEEPHTQTDRQTDRQKLQVFIRDPTAKASLSLSLRVCLSFFRRGPDLFVASCSTSVAERDLHSVMGDRCPRYSLVAEGLISDRRRVFLLKN
ncbi:hypothetical protein CY35_10G050200 [Sphagnum magellanicum]|nr:hypothetical protein CY35_10G050200 [Sphagnum magellanicum]